MSRHLISKNETLGSEIIVGWDNPINTYFCQWFYEEDLLDMIGESFSEYCNIEKFKSKLSSMGVELSEEIIETLEKDKDNSRPRTSLQNMINGIFN